MPSSRTTPPRRIASLLPSSTEIICALGLGDRLVLRSHECDHPTRVRDLPFATSPKIAADGTSYGIDERVRALVQEGLSVYRVDARVLQEAAPDIILTQDHCEVCAVSADEIRKAARRLLDPSPEIVSLEPATLDDIFSDIAQIGEALGVPERGRELATELRRRMDLIARQADRRAGRHRPRVLTIEWLDPLMVAGNWMPELVAMAGGENVAGTPGEHSPFVDWEELKGLDPDVIVILPCGFSIDRTLSEMEALTSREGWNELRAVREGRVALADGHHFFNRPGPRIAESLEILVEVLHPDGPRHGHRGEGWIPWDQDRGGSEGGAEERTGTEGATGIAFQPFESPRSSATSRHPPGEETSMGPVRQFMEKHFLHFNARETVAAARAYEEHLEAGGRMLVSLAGAMSTGELGIILSRMIREDKVHAISCTGANLEEDVFNLLGRDEYEVVPNWRALSAADEVELYERGLNRVTDICIPEDIMRHLEARLLARWRRACEEGERKFPFQYLYDILDSGELEEHYQADPRDSWLLAAREKGIPVYSPGWEDSTTGQMFAANVLQGKIPHHQCVKSGTEQFSHLIQWYKAHHGADEGRPSVGFFQIGGGIAGDFAICAVPSIIQDMKEDAPFWGYFCQISDAEVSYGGYSGAVPNEKITWGKLDADTPKFLVKSDATIVAPLIFGYVLGD